MSVIDQASDVSHVIQLAVAPVFLLTGIGAMLSVMSNRLGRIVDRARLLEDRLAGAGPQSQLECQAEFATLSRRARLINIAMILCATCAILICMLIVALFGGALLELRIATAIALLFTASMIVLIASLVVFLREITLATRNLQIGIRRAAASKAPPLRTDLEQDGTIETE
jgi:Protein of unknown function (DUF2721)